MTDARTYLRKATLENKIIELNLKLASPWFPERMRRAWTIQIQNIQEQLLELN